MDLIRVAAIQPVASHAAGPRKVRVTPFSEARHLKCIWPNDPPRLSGGTIEIKTASASLEEEATQATENQTKVMSCRI
jgi:hypothetical protein